MIYLLDKVAALATDSLLEHVSDPKNTGVAGYLPFREGTEDGKPKDSYLVSFFTSDIPPRIAYEVRVAADTPPAFKAYDPPKEAVPGFQLFVRARQLAITEIPELVQPINPLVIPAEAYGEKGILVYLLAGSNKPNVAIFGKHYRVLVSMDGSRIKYMKPLSKGIIEASTLGPNGEKPRALGISHLVTDYPLETHVFNSLLTGLPVYVITSRGVWCVDGDKIRFIVDKPPDEWDR
ncbi:MAG: hypothetical protein JXR49_12815 [Acidobacteria bacterium]|nr:hypothetical protein [Acidobacteriota bacterium]